jgi:hypothetical protein
MQALFGRSRLRRIGCGSATLTQDLFVLCHWACREKRILVVGDRRLVAQPLRLGFSDLTFLIHRLSFHQCCGD